MKNHDEIECYKVVKSLYSELVSVMTHDCGMFSITYKVGEFVQAKVSNSGLFVFKTLLDARSFLDLRCTNEYIYKAVARGIFPKPILADNWDNQTLIELWKQRKYRKKFTHLCRPPITIPHGTIMVKEVKLLYCVQ